MAITTFKPSINLIETLHSIDWLVLCITCSITVAIIIYGHRKKDLTSPTEYLLMGRQLTLPLFVATLVATWYGGIMGVTQIAFEQGIYNLFTQGIFWYCTYIIFAMYFVKKIRGYGAMTLPDLVKNVYGAKSAKLTAIFVFFKTLPISYAISIGLLLQLLLPLPLIVTTSIGVIIVTVYSAIGGLRAIVYSNVMQFILMCMGLASVFIFSVFEFGGISFLQSNLPEQHFSICGSHTLSTTLVWFFIACSATFINPAFYQRCFAAKSSGVAITGILLSTLIWFAIDICTTFGAMYARAIIPEADSLHAYITYGVQLLPIGLRGLFIASILATILSTLDSFLFITSNLLYYDIPLFKRSKPYVSVVATSALTILLSSLFGGNIEKVWFICKSYFSACLLLPILFGYFVPRLARDSVFYCSGIFSCVGMTIWELYFKSSMIDSFYIGCSIAGLVFAIYWLSPLLLNIRSALFNTRNAQDYAD